MEFVLVDAFAVEVEEAGHVFSVQKHGATFPLA